MLQLGDGRDLAAKALGAERRGEIGMQNLEGDGTLVLRVASEIDRRHSAASELALDRVRYAKRDLQLIRIRCSQLEALPGEESARNLEGRDGGRQR